MNFIYEPKTPSLRHGFGGVFIYSIMKENENDHQLTEEEIGNQFKNYDWT